MKRLYWHIAGRFYEARSERARKRMDYFRCVAEKFFAKLRGSK